MDDLLTATGDSPVAVALRDVHVTYRVAAGRPKLADLLQRRERTDRTVHAVRGLNLTAHRGEAIGLIGRNGSGKSTTLRALAGLLPVDRGQVLATARPVLLGVNAALQPGLTGRRNIELGCLALGMARDDVAARVSTIGEFAGLTDVLERPISTYSSGMRARLHFAIATSIDPEILLVDEALAVGDQTFRRRADARIDELLDAAGTVFLVSHSLHTLRQRCSRLVWVDRGQVRMDGEPDDVADAYTDAA